MIRPTLVHFLAIQTDEFISIKASLTVEKKGLMDNLDFEKNGAKSPISNIKLLRSGTFGLKFVGLNSARKEIYSKNQESDSFGNFYFKIPMNEALLDLSAIQVFETSMRPGLELLLGIFIPLKFPSPKKLIICDFDKTLLETRYSTTREVYNSLFTPLEKYKTVQSSVHLLKGHLARGYHPFILSASPHFYEENIRDWLYKNEIFTAGIFLKDYRQVLSPFKGDLRPKDIKLHGLYKLNHLLDILLMTGIPQNLVLMGDNFESDPLIYLTLAKILKSKNDPWIIWKEVIGEKSFKLNKKQNFLLLNKIFQLNNLLKKYYQNKENVIEMKIFIRKRHSKDELKIPEIFSQEMAIVESFDF
jgi:hypothetical protein